MTEDEAKTKWCCGPKVMADSIYAARPDRAGKANSAETNGLCIGSACMAWRTIFADDPTDNALPDSKIAIAGFCGLAGEP